MPNIVNNYTNEQLASAAYKDTGAASDEVPLNSDLGTAATANVQTSPTDTTADALMAVGAFGLGGYVISADTDYDSGDYLVGGNYITPSSAMSNTPSDYTTGRHVIAVDGTELYIAQTLYGVTSSDKGKVWSRAFDSVTWSAWQRTDPQAFGIGGDAASELSDADNVQNEISYVGSVALNRPLGVNAAVIDVSGAGNNYGFQFGGRGLFQSPQVRMQEAGVFTAWQPVYTGANFQPETVGGIGVVKRMRSQKGSNIAIGESLAGSLIRNITVDSNGAVVAVLAASGTWKNVSGIIVANLEIADFVRTA